MNDRDADTDQERQVGLASVGATLAAAREAAHVQLMLEDGHLALFYIAEPAAADE